MRRSQLCRCSATTPRTAPPPASAQPCPPCAPWYSESWKLAGNQQRYGRRNARRVAVEAVDLDGHCRDRRLSPARQRHLLVSDAIAGRRALRDRDRIDRAVRRQASRLSSRLPPRIQRGVSRIAGERAVRPRPVSLVMKSLARAAAHSLRSPRRRRSEHRSSRTRATRGHGIARAVRSHRGRHANVADERPRWSDRYISACQPTSPSRSSSRQTAPDLLGDRARTMRESSFDENPRLGLPGFVGSFVHTRAQPSRRYAARSGLDRCIERARKAHRGNRPYDLCKMPG